MSAADRLNDRSIPCDPPTLRETLSAFELEELEALEALENRADSGFDFHDTIPAPPWHGELSDAEYELQPLPPLPAS